MARVDGARRGIHTPPSPKVFSHATQTDPRPQRRFGLHVDPAGTCSPGASHCRPRSRACRQGGQGGGHAAHRHSRQPWRRLGPDGPCAGRRPQGCGRGRPGGIRKHRRQGRHHWPGQVRGKIRQRCQHPADGRHGDGGRRGPAKACGGHGPHSAPGPPDQRLPHRGRARSLLHQDRQGPGQRHARRPGRPAGGRWLGRRRGPHLRRRAGPRGQGQARSTGVPPLCQRPRGGGFAAQRRRGRGPVGLQRIQRRAGLGQAAGRGCIGTSQCLWHPGLQRPGH